jgi:hypothetical protein
MAKLITTSNTLTGIKFETFSDIPNLQLWLDASDENSVNYSSLFPLDEAYYLRASGYLTTTAFALGTNDFTIEGWINVMPGTFGCLITNRTVANSPGSNLFYIGAGLDNKIQYRTTSGGMLLTTTSLIPNTWYHLAVVRESGVVSIFVNGNFEGSMSDTGNKSNNVVRIGLEVGQLPFNGYVSNLRVVNGLAVYPGSLSFTVPSVPLSSITDTGVVTEILTLQDPILVNNGNPSIILTPVGTLQASLPSTFLVNSWFDKSPNALTATQPVINNQTTYLSAEINNLNVLNFDGTDDFLTLSTPISTGISYTQFFVFNRAANNIDSVSLGNIGTTHNYSYLWYKGDTPGGPNANRMFSYTLPTNQNRGTAAINTSGTHIGSITQSIPRNTVDFYLDGINRLTNFSSSFAGQSLTTSDIGRGESSVTFYHNGQYGEVLQMAFEAPDYEVNLVNQRLFNKWKVPKIPPYNKIPQTILATSISALSTTLGTWAVEPTGFNIQWQKSSNNSTYTNIPLATSTIYNPTTSDYSSFIRSSISASNVIGISLPSFSNVLQLTTQNIIPATLSRTTIFTVSATRGTWVSTMPLIYFYQYQVSAVNTSGWENFGTLTTSTTAYLSAYELTAVNVRTFEYAYNSTLGLPQ